MKKTVPQAFFFFLLMMPMPASAVLRGVAVRSPSAEAGPDLIPVSIQSRDLVVIVAMLFAIILFICVVSKLRDEVCCLKMCCGCCIPIANVELSVEAHAADPLLAPPIDDIPQAVGQHMGPVPAQHI
jgi:hypothetical protein